MGRFVLGARGTSAAPALRSTVVVMDVTWPFEDPGTVVVAGDWHGNGRAAQNAVSLAASLGAPLVLQLGDFGMWPGPEGAQYLREVEDAAEQAQVHVAWIDGNHEDFPQLYEYPVRDTGLRQISPRLHHIPRGAGWAWRGVRFRALGGATSVDRAHRIPGVSWWHQEHVTDADLEAATSGGACDVLLTHDCPAGVDIPGIKHRDYVAAAVSGWPISALEHAWDHRDRLAEVIPALKPAHLWHGHFHVRYSAPVVLHDQGLTRVEGLGDDGQGPLGNLMVATLGAGVVTVDNAFRDTGTQAESGAGG